MRFLWAFRYNPWRRPAVAAALRMQSIRKAARLTPRRDFAFGKIAGFAVSGFLLRKKPDGFTDPRRVWEKNAPRICLSCALRNASF
jgi:hypothetical protein